MSVDHWEFDMLQAQLGFMEFANVSNPEWTEDDAETLEEYCSALMQASHQMTGCRGHGADTRASVSFDELPVIQNTICVLACRMVLAGAHRKDNRDE